MSNAIAVERNPMMKEHTTTPTPKICGVRGAPEKHPASVRKKGEIRKEHVLNVLSDDGQTVPGSRQVEANRVSEIHLSRDYYLYLHFVAKPWLASSFINIAHHPHPIAMDLRRLVNFYWHR